MRVALWAEYFSKHHPDENLDLVKFALQARSQGHNAGVVAMMAFSRLVIEHRGLIQRRLLPSAVVQNASVVLELIIQRGPLKAVEANSVRVPKILPDRDLTLGERRTLARSADRNVLTRLLTDPDPGVIAILLRNPKVLERDVLRIASGQPNLAAVLSEVFVNDRWCRRRNVQLALLQNPYTPRDLSRNLLELMDETGLREVLQARSIDSTIRDAARDKLRPMMKSPIDVAEVKDEWVVELLDRRDADPNDEPGAD